MKRADLQKDRDGGDFFLDTDDGGCIQQETSVFFLFSMVLIATMTALAHVSIPDTHRMESRPNTAAIRQR